VTDFILVQIWCKVSSMTYEEWCQLGMAEGWVGPAVCYTHDGLPTTEAEDAEFGEGDPCIHVMRLYSDPETKIAVEENHSPSLWRK
jgi:hypothetical protein